MTTAMGGRARDAALAEAIETKGLRHLARKVGASPSTVSGWRRVPRERLFAFAEASGIPAERLRPDLAHIIEAERDRRWRERAQARFALSGDGVSPAASVRDRAARQAKDDARMLDLLDLGLVVEALRYGAERQGLTLAEVLAAPRGGGGGLPTPEQAARSYGMALAVVVGRVRAETVASLIGVSRQAVDNAAERYMRSRDGDDADDAEDGRVIERGRVRVAKAADDALWAAEQRFVERLRGAAA